MSTPNVIFTTETESDKKSSATSTATTTALTTTSSASQRCYEGPGSLLIDKLAIELTKVTGSFLNYASWNRVSETSKGALHLFRQLQALQDARKRTHPLLTAVLKAQPQSVDAALLVLPAAVCPKVEKIISDYIAARSALLTPALTAASASSKTTTVSTSKHCAVLIKSHEKEAYFNKKTKAMETIRTWTAISPLEAAAWCGDNFMVRRLLQQVATPEQKKEAARQLQAMLDRKETAENATYLAPFKSLIEAYTNYIAQHDVLYPKSEWGKLDKLWLSLIGTRQRFLSTYGLQEFCSTTPFLPPPPFTAEPERACRFNDGTLDLLDIGISLFLFKGPSARWGGGMCVAHGARAALDGAQLDSLAFSRLCEVRTSELGVIIKELNATNSKEVTASQSHLQNQRKLASKPYVPQVPSVSPSVAYALKQKAEASKNETEKPNQKAADSKKKLDITDSSSKPKNK